MIEINLLPKSYRKRSGGLSFGKVGTYSIAAAIGVVAILAAVTFYQMNRLASLEQDIERANKRADLLRKDIKVVDGLTVVKQKIQQRMSAVERLDQHRSAWVRILEDMSSNVPEYVWLSEFQEFPVAKVDSKKSRKKSNKDDEVKQAKVDPNVRPVMVKGYTFTLNALAAFMIRMMRSDYFDNVELVATQDTAIVDTRAYTFELSANVHYLSDEDLRKMVAQSQEATEPEKARHESLN